MKLSVQWLRERTAYKGSMDELIHALTMAGIEVNAVEPVAKPLDNVVVGHVLAVDKHPDAERLHVCTVNVGQAENLNIVCGASNVKSEMKVAVALIGGRVGDIKIKKAKLRGVESSGMICSSSELGLTETSEGIMPLPHDAPVGQDINAYLHLDDQSITIELTPNRGDCLSLEGVAREVCVSFDLDYTEQEIKVITPTHQVRFSVQLQNPQACPHYIGRVLENIHINLATPLWLKECLRRSGLHSINPIVDVMNYVMLELGQPLHAFDLDKLSGNIQVRYAKTNESITLLNDQSYVLDSETLIIADEKKPLAIAGIMGGKDSAVSAATTRIFIESAYFDPRVISKKARQYGLHTDASHRFERGVDYRIQGHAIERATQLLSEIMPCMAGEIIEVKEEGYLPQDKTVTLRYAQIKKLLGIEIDKQHVQSWLKKLGFTILPHDEAQCQVNVPSHRFDVAIEQDLIEEVARCYGLNEIPNQVLVGELPISELDDTKISVDQCRQLLIERDYHEAVTYSFVSPELQVLLNIDKDQVPLINPISSDMAVMRTSLIPGLLNAIQYNQARQQNRVRLFEIANCFHANNMPNNQLAQETLMLAGVCSGFWQEQQWGSETRKVDFFDIKADVEALFQLTGELESFYWQADNLPMMHPGQCAAIYRKGKKIGFLGALHPAIIQKLDINPPIFIFECNFNELVAAKLSEFAKLSKYPSIKRDIAFLVDKKVTAGELFDFIQRHASDCLVKLQLFDVYQGVADAVDKKSLAFSLTIQHPSKTLQDSEVDELITRLIRSLQQEYAIILRGESYH